MNLTVPTGLVVNPIPRTSEYFKNKDYVPKYHVFYDPAQAVPRVIDILIGMESAEIEVTDEQ